jgi:hypothetical protein
MSFTFRGLELCGRRMWERERVLAALDFIQAHDMTALVLHEPDLIHQLVFPSAYFDPYAKWKSAPTRRGENALQNNRIYFDHVFQLAHNRGVETWLEVKELTFPDEVLEMRPDLIKKGGIVCPSDPFWFEFTEQKFEELLRDFPLITGIILSPGSPEGRAARAQNKCDCDVCRATPLKQWYGQMIAAVHRPIARHGKRLSVRDFAYKPVDHEPLIAAMAEAPKDVIFCIKTTPHDFYPTFPDNPAFGRLDREQWIEYDVEGQFYGWGVFPCFTLEDMRKRFAFTKSKGVTGGVFRTEWERINDWYSLESINIVNLIGAAMLSADQSVTGEAVCRRFLEDRGWPIAAAPWLAATLAETWPIIRGALFMDDFVFADASMFPRSIGRAWWTVETKHSLEIWDPSRRGSFDLDPERFAELMAEKQDAVAAVQALMRRVEAGAATLGAELHDYVRRSFARMDVYVGGLALCAEVCLLSRWLENKPGNERVRRDFEASVDRLAAFGKTIVPLAEEALVPHQMIMLVDHRRIADIVAEGRKQCAALDAAPLKAEAIAAAG